MLWSPKGGPKMKIAVGMDLHARKTTAFAVPANASIDIGTDEHTFLYGFNREFSSFPSDEEGMSAMVSYLRSHEAHILVENSSKTHEIYWMLTDRGMDVTVAFAADLYRITKSKKKTDRHDAIELAGYMRRKLNGEIEFRTSFMPNREWLMRRELCRTLYDESSMLSDTRRQIRSHMLLHGIAFQTSDIVGAAAMKFLSSLGDPVLNSLVARAADSKKRMRNLEKDILRLFGDEILYRRLRTILGVGPVIAAYIAGMTIDIGRFDNAGEFSAFFGLVPGMRESAGSSPHCHITRRGDDIAREMIFQATLVHIKNDPDDGSGVTRAFRRLHGDGKRMPYKKAMTAAARKMAEVMFAVMKSGRPYERR